MTEEKLVVEPYELITSFPYVQTSNHNIIYAENNKSLPNTVNNVSYRENLPLIKI